MAKNARKLFCLFVLLLLGVNPRNIEACTDFLLVAEDQNVVVGRTMEWGASLESKITRFPKGAENVSLLDSQQTGLSWVTKYAFIGVTTLGINFVADGMNDQGLSIGVLWFPGAIYPPVAGKDLSKTISLNDLGNWILGSFSTLPEVKEALNKVQIMPLDIAKLGGVPTIHLSVHDRSGKSMVVEFVDGEMQITENPVGVLTNAPKFEWHLTNLRNYINLTAINAGSVSFGGSVLDSTGQGSGLLGIPGDWTPPSRFARIAVFKNFAKKAADASENINLALHLLNTVDIPYGTIRASKDKDFDYTQWSVVKDLTNGKFYYRTYQDLNIKEEEL